LGGIIKRKKCVVKDEQKVRRSSCYWGGTMRRNN